jgi:hypothetical protein
MSELNATYGFVALCVAFYAHERFTNPPVRAMTTAIQYHVAWFGYLVSTLILFAALSAVLESSEALKFLTILTGAELSTDAEKLPAPFLAALFLTTLLPRLPVLKDLDTRMQQFFRDLGEIPYKALSLGWHLRNEPFQISPGVREKVTERLMAAGIEDANGMVAAPADATESLWIKLTALVVQLQEEVESNRRPRFKRYQEQSYEKILAAFARQAEVAPVVFRMKGEQPLLAKKFRQDCRDLLKEVTDVISRGMLQSEYGLNRAYQALEGWGFEGLRHDCAQRYLSPNKLIEVVLVVLVWMFLFFLFVGGRAMDGDPKVADVLMKASAIAMIVGAAIACAIYPKCAFKHLANRAADGQRPWGFYLLSALLSGVCWLTINFVRLWLEGAPTIEGGDTVTIAQQLADKRPWILMSLATAFFTAFMADNDPARWKLSETSARWLEGLAMALVLTTAMYFVTRWFQDIKPVPAKAIPMMLESASVVGFIIGFFVPTFYRRIPQRQQERQRLSVDLNEDQDGDPVVPVVPVEHNDRRAAA